ncbi:MAG: TolC family protein [Terracidiphilus sp.]
MTESVKRRLFPAACAFVSLVLLPCAVRSQQTQAPAAPMPPLQLPAAQAPAGPVASLGPRLTLADAERMAIERNPNISVARLIALAQAQVTREVRSAELPTVQGNLTAVGAHENSRITAGLLNNPSVYDRAAGGLSVSQLITDFGRTHNLVRSAQSNTKAQLENERATELDITLTVEQAFYQALTSQAVLKVAEATVKQRQATVDQVGALSKAKLRSDLDLSFAEVQLSQAKLLLLDAQNDAADAMASLNTVLGSEQDEQYTLVDETTASPDPAPEDAEALLQAAFTARPDLAALNYSYTAARQFSTAEHELWMPTVSALAAAGGTPVRADQIQSSWYGAVGANISIPVFNGFLYNARAQEAKLRANAAGEQVRNLRDVIARDLRTAVLNAQNAFQRIGVTREMLNESNMALDLSEERYKIGLSGIVELTQAQLAQTQAEIDYANARYAYQTALAVVRFQTGQ